MWWKQVNCLSNSKTTPTATTSTTNYSPEETAREPTSMFARLLIWLLSIYPLEECSKEAWFDFSNAQTMKTFIPLSWRRQGFGWTMSHKRYTSLWMRCYYDRWFQQIGIWKKMPMSYFSTRAQETESEDIQERAIELVPRTAIIPLKWRIPITLWIIHMTIHKPIG